MNNFTSLWSKYAEKIGYYEPRQNKIPKRRRLTANDYLLFEYLKENVMEYVPVISHELNLSIDDLRKSIYNLTNYCDIWESDDGQEIGMLTGWIDD